MGLKEARVAAAGHMKEIAAGADPAHQIQKVKKIDTVDQFLDRYIEDQGGGSSWAREVERIFKKDVRPAIGGYKINKVTRPDIVSILNAVKNRGAGVGANRTLAAIRREFNWGIDNGLLTSANPASGIPPRVQEEGRSRALSEGEIRNFWHGLEHAKMATGTKLALRLALVTGQRIGEVCGALRSEVDLNKAEWLIPGKRVKSRREHYVPLSSLGVHLFAHARSSERP
jgi:integrase